MKLRNALSTLTVVGIAFCVLIAFGIPTFGQEAQLQNEASAPKPAPAMNEVLQHNIENWVLQGRGIPNDWSHHHLVFSNPGTEQDAIKNGTHDRWLSIVNDPRYIIQQLKRRAAQGPAAADIASIQETAQAATQDPTPAAKLKKSKMKKDWSESLGSGAAASASGTFTGAPTASQTVEITDGSNTLTLTATASTKTGTVNNTQFSGADPGDTVTIGGVVYEFGASQSGANGCSGTSYNVCVWWGETNTQATQSLEAAINNNPSECPSQVAGNGTWGSTCYTVVTAGDAPNPGASAIRSNHTVTVTNLTYTALALATNDTGTFSLSASSISQVASCSSSTTGTLIIDGNSTSQQAANLAGAIAACETSYPTVGVTATSSGATVTVTATTAGPGGNSIGIPETLSNFTWANGATTLSGGEIATVQPNMWPAVYGASLTSASCSDFAVYPTGQAGSSTAANIIAYDNLYVGAGACEPAKPTVYWAYNTGAYAVTTSPILSVDGKQIAFIESNGATASLVLIKWAAETGESVTAPLTLANSASGSAYRSCTPTASTPCMYTIAFTNGDNDTLSAPFYDFASDDALYVGDDSGNLHQFTGVFVGSPAESGGPWPVSLGAAKIASPVYDSVSGYVFAGDMVGTLHSVGSGNAGTIAGNKHGTASGLGDAIADGPLVDGNAKYLYTFVTTSSLSEPGANAVYGYSTAFTTNATPGVVPLGTGNTGYYLYSGSFDNIYFESSTNTGNLYVVGNTGATNGAALYQVGISNGVLSGTWSTPVLGLTTSGAHPWPSPLTEFCNGSCTVADGVTSGNDYVFFSVTNAAVGGCTAGAGHGCILSYKVSNPASVGISGTGLTVTTPGTNGCWATGGIEIDNAAATTGASQIYFVNLNGAAAGGGAGGGTPTSSNCTSGAGPTIQAVQASQASP